MVTNPAGRRPKIDSRWLGALLCWMWCCDPVAVPGAQPPNIVLIVSDDQGYPDLGCIGLKPIQTPNLDRLASEGVRLTNFYVTWPACTPSRGSILTGRHPRRNGLYDMIRNDLVNYGHRYTEREYATSPEMTLGMDVREVLISQVLKEAGYATGMIGKWDGGRARRFLPRQRGFDSFYGFANTGIDYFTHERYGVPSMFRDNDRTEADKGSYATDLFRREAVNFILTNRERPFFLYVAFNAPHGASSFAAEDDPKARVGVQAPGKFVERYADASLKENLKHYYAAVTCMDEAIGEIDETLRELKLQDNTLVLFLSDNGGSGNGGNQPLRGSKSSLWEGGLRVPFVARWPGRIPAGVVRDEFLTTLELFPTFVAAAEAKPPRDVTLDGFDMLPVLSGRTPSPRTEMFWEFRGDKAARIGQFKWLDSEKGRGLFDLSNDPGESHDLSESKPEIVARIRQRYAAWSQALEAAEPRGPFRDY
jgi:arylsulfatase A-like enzyme